LTRKSYAKVNIFLKIIGQRDNYHQLVSRFIKIKDLFDIVSFKKSICSTFTLGGNFNCNTNQNTIYKAYVVLASQYPEVKRYFQTHRVMVEKNIPELAGLGGGSSNCATFINMVNEACSLNLTKGTLANIGLSIGADIPFFIYEHDSANVTGIGEIVEKFDEKPINIDIFTPAIKCDTATIFKCFRNNFYKEIKSDEANKLLHMKSIDILKMLDIVEANDLYLPALSLNKELKKYSTNDWYFSGTGSSFFRIKT